MNSLESELGHLEIEPQKTDHSQKEIQKKWRFYRAIWRWPERQRFKNLLMSLIRRNGSNLEKERNKLTRGSFAKDFNLNQEDSPENKRTPSIINFLEDRTLDSHEELAWNFSRYRTSAPSLPTKLELKHDNFSQTLFQV